MRTTDPQNEIFDVVDEDDNVVGQARRGEVHKDKNLLHRSIGVAVFNHRGELFLQQRSATKDTYPLCWTISCSGHVNSGESYDETVRRELKEELGIIFYKGTPCGTAGGPLEPVAKFICRAPHETEIVILFKAKIEPCMRFNLNREEILQGKFFTRRELVKLVQLGTLELSFMGKIALQKLGWISH